MLSLRLENMKNALKEKFKNNVLVKPLYRKLKNGNKIKPKLLVDSRFKLDGNGICVKRNIVNINGGVSSRQKIIKQNRIFVCGSRENKNNKRLFDKVILKPVRNGLRKDQSMLSTRGNTKVNGEADRVEDNSRKLLQADNVTVVVQKIPNTWLRLYPLPKLPGESVGSVIFRCILCQLGLCTILILWTTVWVFVIHHFEGPHEIKVSLDFDKEQNLLVIVLATELRQITPLSPKWRRAIERRIQDERHLTMEAVSRGARVHPGQYWDLSGTFLFTVYVMTALGFGAPVPHTTWGRISAVTYATFAVPTHIYLMLNASMCLVVQVEIHFNQLKCSLLDKRPFVLGRTTPQNEVWIAVAPFSGTSATIPGGVVAEVLFRRAHRHPESPNCSRSSEVLKANRSGIGKKIMRFLSLLGAYRSVPLIAVIYYVCGAAAFGLARGNTSLDIALFPLEFTTSGGLDCINGHVRILYGWYVEGAMMLLSCALATLRRHSGGTVTSMTEKYRLFESEELIVK